MAKKYTAAEAKCFILDTATELFIEKGYEKTSISDIVRQLDGLSKGAVYHHFESKEAIIDGVIQRFIIDTAAIEGINQRRDLTGLEKIQELMYQSMFDLNLGNARLTSFSLLDNPKFFAQYIMMTNQQVAPYVATFLRLGNQDGSVRVNQPKEMAEVALLMLSTWFIQALYPETKTRFFEKLAAAQLVLKNSGMDILNEKMMKRINQGILGMVERLNENKKS